MQVQHSTEILHYTFSRTPKYKTSKMFPVESSLKPISSSLTPEECFKPAYSRFRRTAEVLEPLGKTPFISADILKTGV